MPSFSRAAIVSGVEKSIKGMLCATLSLTDPLADPIGGLYRKAVEKVAGKDGEEIADTLLDGIAETRRAIRWYACGKDILSEPVNPYAPPFTGGQCLIEYLVTVQVEVLGSLDIGNYYPTSVTVAMMGKITGKDFFIRCIDRENGGKEYLLSKVSNPAENYYSRFVGYGIYEGLKNPKVLSVTPRYGQPDNCGNLPSDLPNPKDDHSFNCPVVINDDDGTPVTFPDIDINLTSPVIGVDGDLTFNVYIPTLSLSGQFSIINGFSPTIINNFNSGQGNRTGDEKGNGSTTPDPDLCPDEPESEKEDKETFIGVVVNSQKIRSKYPETAVYNGNAPTLLVPRIAQCSFLISEPIGKRRIKGWTSPIDIKSVNAFIPAPVGVNVVNYAIAWQPSWTGKATAVIKKEKKSS